jgi:thiol-disulfide isomerase/thioredoxin
MKNKIILLTLLIAFLITGCTQNKIKTPALPDSIELIAYKTRDTVNRSFHFCIPSYKADNHHNYLFPGIKGVPDTLRDVNIYFGCLDPTQAFYQAYKAGFIENEDFIQNFRGEINDTIHCAPGYAKIFIAIATGISKKGTKYCLVDANNNYDFSDEKVYTTDEKISTDQPHKVIFERVFDNKIKTDSTWIAFYEDRVYDILDLQSCERTFASFTFDSVQYDLTIRPSRGLSVKYEKAVIFRLEDKLHKEVQVFGENQYARLNDSYYQVSCSDDGRTVNMQKDTAAWKKGSTQLNMPALPFNAITLKGDSVRFPSDFKGKYVLLDFWSTGCPHCVQDIREHYISIYKKYGGEKFEIVGIADNTPSETESFVKKNMIPWTMIPAKKSLIQDIYRIEGYPFLYLINPDGVIVSKGADLRKEKINTVLEKYLGTDSQKAD